MVYIKKKKKTKNQNALYKEIGAIGYSYFTDQEPEAQRSEATCPRPHCKGIWELGLHQAAWKSPALSPGPAQVCPVGTQAPLAFHQDLPFSGGQACAQRPQRPETHFRMTTGASDNNILSPFKAFLASAFKEKKEKVYHIRKCDQKLWFSLAGYSFSHTMVTREINL